MYTVILVDDQPLCLRGMESGFNWKKYGFEIVHKTTNPERALEMIKELNPDVVCTDMRMPNISGIELIRAAAILKMKAKFIIVSGYEDFDKACEAVQYHAFRYCLKPIDRQNADSILEELKLVLDEENTVRNHAEGTISEKSFDTIHNLKFRKMVTYINENYKDSLSLDELAEKFEINASFASRLFSQYFSMGYSQYLNEVRLKNAAELLQKTRISIEEVSYAVGFKDSAYFSRVFKKYYGDTPYAYRCRF